MKATALARQPAFVYFWLGVLTGALIVMASLMIRSYADNGAASVLRAPFSIPTSVQQYRAPVANQKAMGPNNFGAMGPNNLPVSMGPNN